MAGRTKAKLREELKAAKADRAGAERATAKSAARATAVEEDLRKLRAVARKWRARLVELGEGVEGA